MANAYFQVIYDENGTSVKFFPATKGGEALKIEEVVKYLEKNKITDYDLVALNKGLSSSTEEETVVNIKSERGYKINELMVVRCAKEDMFAVARFYPPSNDGERETLDEIKRDLEYLGIKYGIDEKILAAFTKTPLYCTNIVIARGKPVIQGKDAYITYQFNTDKNVRPKRNEDGSVNFHELNNISHIKKGDVLATLTREVPGTDGITVKGVTVKPRDVGRKTFKYGRNIEISEDGLSMISMVNGHVELADDKVFVSNVYDVPADVDNSTGDITYDGNVFVHGSVRTGFKIEATGDVEVLGVVEGANIKAGGQIILHHGMQGMGKGELIAGGNVVSKFLESAVVKSGGFIEADTIIQCNVQAKGNITVDGSKGNIIGGSVKSETMVSAKTIGSDMGISTVVEVGIDPVLKEKVTLDGELIKKKEAERNQIASVLEVYKKKKEAGKLDKSKLPMYIKSVENFKNLSEEIDKLNEEMAELFEQMGTYKDACVKVTRDIYSGVRVIVSEEHLVINQSLSHCKFVKERGMVKAVPI